MSRFVLATLGGLICAVPAYAQDVTHSTSVGIGYAHEDLDGYSSDAVSLEAESEIRTGRVSIGLDLGFNRSDDGTADLEQFSVQIAPTYWLTPGFGLGAYAGRDSLNLDGTLDFDLESYGLEAEMRNGQFGGAVFFGETAVDVLGAGATMKDVGLRVRGDITKEVSLWGSGVQSRLDLGGTDITGWSYALGANLLISDGFGSYASFQSSGIDDTGLSADVFAVGLSWTTDLAGQEVMLSGEYASGAGNSPFGSVDGDRISLGATVLLGDAQRKRTPSHGVANSGLRGERNALSGLLGSIGY